LFVDIPSFPARIRLLSVGEGWMQLQNIILSDSNVFSGEDKNWSGMAAFQPTDCNALQEKKNKQLLE